MYFNFGRTLLCRAVLVFLQKQKYFDESTIMEVSNCALSTHYYLPFDCFAVRLFVVFHNNLLKVGGGKQFVKWYLGCSIWLFVYSNLCFCLFTDESYYIDSYWVYQHPVDWGHLNQAFSLIGSRQGCGCSLTATLDSSRKWTLSALSTLTSGSSTYLYILSNHSLVTLLETAKERWMGKKQADVYLE